MNEDFTDIGFHHGSPSHSFIDRKNEVRISMGRAAVPAAHAALAEKFGHVLLSVTAAGMDVSRFDQICNMMRLNAQTARLDVLVTKGQTPFDGQWYILGDIAGLLRAAQDSMLRPPFGPALHDDIMRAAAIINRTS